MTMTRRDFGKGVLGLSVGAAALGAPTILRASAYPDRAVNYIVAYNPGGESDVTARMQQRYFKDIAGQSLVIVNKPGAGGATAWAQLNGFDPDGYTIMGTIVPHIILQPAMKKVGYQTDDIDVVYFFHYTPDAIVVKADSPYRTLNDLIEDTKARPGAVTFGGSGINSANHLASEIFADMTGAITTYIPFKGSAPTITAVLGGQVAAAMSYTTQGVKAGEQVRTLAVATEERVSALPDAPTFKELGFDYVGGAYRGVAVPKNTPDDVRSSLSEIIGQINKNADFQAQMNAAGYQVVDVAMPDVPAFIEERRAAYAPAIKRLRDA